MLIGLGEDKNPNNLGFTRSESPDYTKHLKKTWIIKPKGTNPIPIHEVTSCQSSHFYKALKKILCFGQPDPTYRNQPTLDFFFYENAVFFVGVFIIEVLIIN